MMWLYTILLSIAGFGCLGGYFYYILITLPKHNLTIVSSFFIPGFIMFSSGLAFIGILFIWEPLARSFFGELFVLNAIVSILSAESVRSPHKLATWWRKQKNK